MSITRTDLTALRDAAAGVIVALLWLLSSIVPASALVLGGDWVGPTAFSVILAGIGTLCRMRYGGGPITRLVTSVAVVCEISAITFVFGGHDWQIDTHMLFFAALATLFCIAISSRSSRRLLQSRCIILC